MEGKFFDNGNIILVKFRKQLRVEKHDTIGETDIIEDFFEENDDVSVYSHGYKREKSQKEEVLLMKGIRETDNKRLRFKLWILKDSGKVIRKLKEV